jgi:tetratricopeptide (TPR) repeat protein
MQSQSHPVFVRREPVTIPTYPVPPPDKNPMFLEKRVYQGSNGKVYPLPFYDRVAEKKVPQKWDAVHMENDFIRVMVLPQLGGRIHVGQDKTNSFDFFYQQHVIKPALVGLAGPWISGGVEFNWPQHHRPATFMPVDVHVEEHEDGSKTVWCSDHEPMNRMKGMHGVCLHPGKAFIELKVRLYNRTPFVQTFLWWANVAVHVHELYQSFFPPDVFYVADHAKRATSEYPLCQGYYYGVNYGERGRKGVPPGELPACFVPRAGRSAPNNLNWYANIPTPCSYMAIESKEDFFGGYDHRAEAGVVHIANHHISPGKKQWTWGNHEFGYAWDRNLTDSDGPYIEIMAGVYTDNQPDFSFLAPGETRTFSQFWYPIHKIGPAKHANLDAAVNLEHGNLGICVTRDFSSATIRVTKNDKTAFEQKADLKPGLPYVCKSPDKLVGASGLTLDVLAADGQRIISYQKRPRAKGKAAPPATEPLLPTDVPSNDELYVTGLHLDQYRHATRHPELYWREALRRDPLDARCNNALGLLHLRRGEFEKAETHFRRAIERLTSRNPNPYDGEPHYNLGLCLRYQMDALLARSNGTARLQHSKAPTLRLFSDAYAAFYKATWNHAWQAAGYHAIAELDCRRADWAKALDHLDRSLRVGADNLKARDLKAIVLRKLGRAAEADALLHETLALDPLDWWARRLLGEKITCDNQTLLDFALDFARAEFYGQAIDLLQQAREPLFSTAPLIGYYLGWLHQQLGDRAQTLKQFKTAACASSDYCFPARLEEISILEAAMRANPRDPKSPYYLGCLLYDKRRHDEAIRLWEKSARLDPTFSIVWRNLGIGYFNIRKQPAKARAAYEKAFRANPQDARLLYERDQLWKRLGETPAKRLAELEKRLDLVHQRDDLSVELSALYNQTGRHEKALALITRRKFRPWEGGEGQALGQHVRTHLALGQRLLGRAGVSAAKTELHGRDARATRAKALKQFEMALVSPLNLGEAKHLLANQSDVWYWLGVASDALGDKVAAKKWWTKAATFRGDFQEMSVRAFSEITYYSALSLERLGKKAAARKLLHELLAWAKNLYQTEAMIDYFATSLPTMLLFEDDLQRRQQATATFLMAQAELGLGQRREARRLLKKVLRLDRSHAPAADLLEATR